MKQRIISVLLCLCLMLGVTPLAAAQETEQKKYLALGDSITAGYGLSTGEDGTPAEKSFAQQVAEKNGYTLTNLAESGETTATLLAKLSGQAEDAAVNQAFAAALPEADVITITIGGNDLMGALYTYLADAYNAANSTQMTAEEIVAAITGGDLTTRLALLNFAAGVLPGFMTSEELTGALTEMGTRFIQIIATIQKANPEAQIIVANQYNPYSHAAEGSTLSQVTAIVSAFEEGVKALNTKMAAASAQVRYTVADVYTAFQGAQQNPCNASFAAMDLDFHPNAYGHSLIAEVVNALLSDGQEEGVPAAQLPFTDVAAGAWYHDAVAFVYEKKLMTGVSDTLFAPDEPLTRAMVWTIMARAAGADTEGGENWYAKAQAWAIAAGVSDGTGANEAITREQLVTMLYRFAKSPAAEGTLAGFPDSGSVSAWAGDAMVWAVSAGIIGGSGGQLAPGKGASRAELATILTRFTAIAG